jgi:hypothetical protein
MSLIRIPKNILHNVDNLSSRTGCRQEWAGFGTGLPTPPSFLILCSSLAFPYCWATLHRQLWIQSNILLCWYGLNVGGGHEFLADVPSLCSKEEGHGLQLWPSGMMYPVCVLLENLCSFTFCWTNGNDLKSYFHHEEVCFGLIWFYLLLCIWFS